MVSLGLGFGPLPVGLDEDICIPCLIALRSMLKLGRSFVGTALADKLNKRLVLVSMDQLPPVPSRIVNTTKPTRSHTAHAQGLREELSVRLGDSFGS